MSGSVSPIFVDHSDLTALARVARRNSEYRSTQQHEQRFWASAVAMADSSVQEVMELTLSSPRLINMISFDAARFPHDIRVQHFDGSNWQDLVDRDMGAPLALSILQSIPATLGKATAVPGHLHPQHSYAGHWEQISFRLRPVTVQRIRLLLKRSAAGTPPLDNSGAPVAYSLAIMNLQVGYRVTTRADVPRTATRSGSLNVRDSFATTDDLLGSSVAYSLRTNSASSILTPDDTSPIWRCEPQPFPHAVVNLYADLRNDLGDPQIIDRIFIDPVCNGSHISLYHSNDVPVGGFQSPSEALTATQAVLRGSAALDRGMLSLGSYGQSADIVIDNVEVGFDPSLPWWIGLVYQPNYGPGVDSNEHPLIDTGAFCISLTSVGILLRTYSGTRFEMPFSYLGRQEIRLIVSYDGQALRLHARSVTDEQEAQLVLAQSLSGYSVTRIYLGSNGAALYGNVAIHNLVLKEEVLTSDNFLDDPDLYCTVSDFIDADTPEAVSNTLLRFAPHSALVDETHPTGLFAGGSQKYESMSWVPVARDYTMQRGWMNLPPINARFVKLEFTNLQPETRDVHVPVDQLVRTFPADVLADYRASNGTRMPVNGDIGTITQQGMANNVAYADYPIYVSTGGTSKGYTNTQAYVADDYSTANRLYASMGPDWAYQNWHSGATAPRFSQVGVHCYNVQVVAQSTKVAYFTGLRDIQFSRTTYSGNDDVGEYEDLLQDDATIARSDWIHDQGAQALASGQAVRAEATSVVYGSSRRMRGLQFAAQQSDPHQLLPDPDFADPQGRNWALVGDAHLGQSRTSSIPALGTVLEVSREVRLGRWEDIRPVYLTWGNIKAANVTYGQLSNPVRSLQTVGGVASLPVDQPVGGRLHAAARVFANKDLASPLWVQVVDSVTDAVLAEESVVVNRDQVTEWHASYTIGDGGKSWRNTWGGLVAPRDQVWANFMDSFARSSATVLGRMDSGQVWQVAGSGSLALASSKAAVTATGQSSAIDTATPWGSLTVQLGNVVAAGTAASSVLLLDLGGHLLFNDGRITSKTTNYSPQTISLASGDVLRFEFVPTQTLTSAQTPASTVAELTPYSMVITRNNTYVATVVSARAFGTIRALAGAVGQTWTSFSWTPSYVEIPAGNASNAMPMPTNGAMASDGLSWLDSAGGNWAIDGIWSFSSRAPYQASVPVASAASAGCGLYYDFGQLFGALVFNVTQIATGVDPTTYYLATLDLQEGSSLLLRADGALVRADGTVLKASAVPSPTAGTITVRFMKTKLLSSAFRTARSISLSTEQTLVFLQGNAVVGTYSGNALWSGTVRGINGYSDSAGHFTVTEGFGWFPEAASVALDSRRPTWGDVSRNGTYRYGDLSSSVGANTNAVYVRIIQKAASSDSWSVDAMSLFHERISWEFSNDGGRSFHPAVDIRNNPNGVLLFPKPDLSNSARPPQNQLVWRVSAWGPGAWVSQLAIRPWYEGMARGVPVRSAMSQHGPNVNSLDHYPPIEQDPRFQVWSKPIPRDWYFAYRSTDSARLTNIATQWITLSLGDALILED